MSEDENKELTEIEAEAIESYITNIYSRKVPEPKAPSKDELSFWNIAGIEAVLYTIAGIGIVIYSSIRTGGMFYIMELLLLKKYSLPSSIADVLSLSAMITSLAAFELFVLAEGFSKGRENKKLTRSPVGLYSSLAVIVGAGVFTGLGLIRNLNDTAELLFYIVLALGTALAGGLVALYAGENIGFTFTKVEKTRGKLNSSHTKDYQKWRDSAVKSYNSSHYAVGTDKAFEFKKKITNEKKTDKFENEYERVLRASIEKFYMKNSRLPTVDELHSIGVSKVYAKKALKKYSGDGLKNG